jgi:hypothetical protein
MSKARSADQLLARLSALRQQPPTDQTREQLVVGLASKISIIVAKAADVALELKVGGLCHAMEDAFARFLGAEPTDKGCQAKTALARAALLLDYPADSIFRAGIRHVQKEGSFGPPVDVAAELRGLCGMGLAQVRARDVIEELIDLLPDEEVQARIGAIRALAMTGKPEAAALLRMKTVFGDRDPAVIGECLTALLRLMPKESLPLAKRLLHGRDEAVCEETILALGTSRDPSAFEMLRDFYQSARAGLRPTLLTAIACMRVPAAREFLLRLLEHDSISVGIEVLTALKPYRADSALCEKLAELVSRRNDEQLKRIIARDFGP